MLIRKSVDEDFAAMLAVINDAARVREAASGRSSCATCKLTRTMEN